MITTKRTAFFVTQCLGSKSVLHVLYIVHVYIVHVCVVVEKLSVPFLDSLRESILNSYPFTRRGK